MSMIRPKFNYCSTDPDRTLTLLEWIEETKKIKLVADPAFQANSVFDNDGRKGRWFTKHRRDYITNLVLNKAPSPFIIADNQKCLDAAIKENRQYDIEYFKKWLKWGPTFMVMDSYNRNEGFGCMFDPDQTKSEMLENSIGFFRNEFGIWPGDYKIKNRKGETVVCEIFDYNCTWEKMPKEMKYHITHYVKVRITTYIDSTQEDLSVICRAVNLGSYWKGPCFRNTFTTYIASDVRDFPPKYKELFAGHKKWFNKNQLITRIPDEFVAEMFWIYNNDFTKNAIGPTKLDDMYAFGKYNKNDVNKIKECVDSFLKIIETTVDQLGGCSYYAFSNRIILLHLFHFYVDVYKNNYRVKEDMKNEMYQKLFDVHTALVKTTDEYKVKGGSKRFKQLITGKQMINSKICNELIAKDFHIMEYCQKKGRRVISDLEKEAKAAEQGMVTPAGEIIHPSILHTGAYHKGHGKKSYKESLTSDYDDAYVQTDKENLKQQDKPIDL